MRKKSGGGAKGAPWKGNTRRGSWRTGAQKAADRSRRKKKR